jgi:tetratricopeptide (TPR) repeat protein
MMGSTGSPQAGAIWPSAFAAAVFALHPVQVESVAWAAELKTVLSGLFFLLTIAAYIYYAKQPRAGRYILLLIVYSLCILTKPVVVTVPFVLLLLDYWPLGRSRWGRLIIEKIPLFALSAILSAITYSAQQHGGAVMALEKMPLDFRIANMFISYIRYIGKTIWPSCLAVFYPPLPAKFPKAIAAICALLFILITVLCVYAGRRKKYIAVGWLLFAGTLVPMIGLVQAGVQAMANRYMYISILGLIIIIAWTAKDFITNRPRWKVILAVSAGIVLSSAIILTRMQVQHWQNSMTLFEYALKVTKNNAIAENNYGCALFSEGRLDDAAMHLSRAARISPLFTEARSNLGKVFLKQGRVNDAIACFNEIINRRQDSAEIYYQLAVALSMKNKYDDAIKYFAKALTLNPEYPNAHRKLGAALLAAGKVDEAIPHLNEALQTNTNQAEVYANLGTAYNQLGKYKQAIENWSQAAKLEPNNPNILNNIAWLLATVNDTSAQNVNKAIEFAQQACKLTDYNEPAILDTLATAYAAAGKFEEAVTTAQQAIYIAQSRDQKDMAGEIQKRLELYKTGRAYIQK